MNLTISGALGAGKTVFARGLARGLGVIDSITSPSYPIIQEYSGRLEFWHMDWYRLGSEDEVIETGAGELLSGQGVCLVEWPDRALELFDESTIKINLRVLASDCREITLEPAAETVAARLDWPAALPETLRQLMMRRPL